MTTIVYSNGVLASDSQATSNGTRMLASFKKIHTPDEGKRWSIYGKRILAIGISGEVTGLPELIKHLEAGIMFETRGKWDAWMNCIAVSDDRSAFIVDGKGDMRNTMFTQMPIDAFVAIGSGSELAEAYLAIGRKPEDVIKLVSKLDVHTGGDVQVWRFPEVVPPDVKPAEPTDSEKALIAKVESQINDIAKDALAKATTAIQEALKPVPAAEPKAGKKAKPPVETDPAAAQE